MRKTFIARVAFATMALAAGPASGNSEAPYLAGDGLKAAFAGATLIGTDWAEYYAPDGAIVGRVRYFGVLHDFTGRWIPKVDQVCFDYERPQYNTCSKFRRFGDQMRHFAADGKPKKDGESRRLLGNRLDEFR
jgi:hypothetical protein